MSDWYIELEYPHEMIDIWNAETVSYTGNQYKIKNVRWNRSINPGESAGFGFSVEPDPPSIKPSNIIVTFGN